MDRGAWWATVHGVAESRALLNDFHSTSLHFRAESKRTLVNENGWSALGLCGPQALPSSPQGWNDHYLCTPETHSLHTSSDLHRLARGPSLLLRNAPRRRDPTPLPEVNFSFWLSPQISLFEQQSEIPSFKSCAPLGHHIIDGPYFRCTLMSAFFKEAISYRAFFCKPPSATHTSLSDQALTCPFIDCLINIFTIRGEQNSTRRYRSKSVSHQPTGNVSRVWCGVWEENKEQKEEKTWWVCVDHYLLVFSYSLETGLFPCFLFSAKGLGWNCSA